MFHTFLIKYAEIGLKGKNRYVFEDALVSHIHHSLKRLDGKFTVTKEAGRIYATAAEEFDYDEVIDALKKVFGIAAICPMVQLEDNGYDDLKAKIVEYVDKAYPDKHFTFKVNTRRANKQYPHTSEEVNRDLGEVILDAFPETKVDVHNPDVLLNVELRAKRINVYSLVIPGPGGMPVGTNGRAMLLLSGGIDSPVAGYMIAKRGVTIEATYFHAPPYTSDRAKQKVVDLAKQVAKYSGPIRLHVVNFTDIQLYIYDQCPHDELTIIMRRYMMRIAEHFAKESRCLGLITGESIGQVASQTMQGLVCTDAVSQIPIFRPLIGMDKTEIVETARQIDTFELSTLPYEDCCTVFTPKHPKVRPSLEEVEAAQAQYDFTASVEKAVANTEMKIFKLQNGTPFSI